MPTVCSECKKHNRRCRVHVSSGRCGECNEHNSRCDIRFTAAEFRRLVSEKQKLQAEIDKSLQAQMEALESLRTARAREDRLRKQMELVDKRGSEAIAVEERGILEHEAEEALLSSAPFEPLPWDDRLLLSPGDWSSLWDLGTDGTVGGVPGNA